MLFKKLFGNKTDDTNNDNADKQDKAMPSLREQLELARRIIHSNDKKNIHLAEAILIKCVEKNVKGANRDLGLHYAKSSFSESKKNRATKCC